MLPRPIAEPIAEQMNPARVCQRSDAMESRLPPDGGAYRKPQREHRTLAHLRAHVDGAPVLLHDPVTDRQPEAGSVRAGGEERIEDLRQDVRWDPGAGVSDGQTDRSTTV